MLIGQYRIPDMYHTQYSNMFCYLSATGMSPKTWKQVGILNFQFSRPEAIEFF